MRLGWLPAFAACIAYTSLVGGAVLGGACTGGPAEPSLTLEGPTEIRVEKLGPVHGPRALRADGTAPSGVVWTVSDGGVAEVRDGAVVALRPGQARVTGTLDAETVAWNLTVDPEVVLGFVDVPASLTVGQELALKVEARAGDQVVPPGVVEWSSSDPAVLTATAGTLHGVAPGIAYVSARHGASEAMAQVEVKAVAP